MILTYTTTDGNALRVEQEFLLMNNALLKEFKKSVDNRFCRVTI